MTKLGNTSVCGSRPVFTKNANINLQSVKAYQEITCYHVLALCCLQKNEFNDCVTMKSYVRVSLALAAQECDLYFVYTTTLPNRTRLLWLKLACHL